MTLTRSLVCGLAVIPLALLGLINAQQRGVDLGLEREAAEFGGEDAYALAVRAVEIGELPTAKRHLKDYVTSSPMDARGLSLVGGLAAQAQNALGTDAAFRAAALLGWRDVPTQLYWFSTALAANDVTTAAQRLDALLRTSTSTQLTEPLLATLEAIPAGREAVTARLALNPDWAASYVQSVSTLQNEQATARMDVIRRAHNAGLTVACEDIGYTVNALARKQSLDMAFALWSIGCANGQARANTLRNADFEEPLPQAARAESPFDWALSSSGSMQVSIEPISGRSGNVLQIRSSGTISEPSASQIVRLAPGNYEVTWQSSAPKTPDEMMRPVVRCLETGYSIATEKIEDRAVRVAIPENCDWQSFAIVPPTRISAAAAPWWIDQIRIRPLG
ncbi:hypothetical protein [Sphingomonas japonica]|uniref:Tetratricopeptide repeat protein n=1 Tax=Sphingomonas japonica TaxID=511662 RepID=A0ABX0U3G8_9SPHN|nr:hypothetical protein [Sphingomonas japonica]NIJ25126.1 hypothetical protein [Sphingomonas japonica]